MWYFWFFQYMTFGDHQQSCRHHHHFGGNHPIDQQSPPGRPQRPPRARARARAGQQTLRRPARRPPPAVADPAPWAWILLISLTNPLLRSQSRRHKRFCSQISVAEKLTTQGTGAMNTWELLFLTRIVGVGPAKPRSDTDLFIYMHHQHGKRDCTKYRLITLNNSFISCRYK